jgi:hypothetical protein
MNEKIIQSARELVSYGIREGGSEYDINEFYTIIVNTTG